MIFIFVFTDRVGGWAHLAQPNRQSDNASGIGL